MKKSFPFSMLVFALVTALVSFAFVQQNVSCEVIKGNGKLVKQERAVSDFHAINVSGGIDILIIPGATEKVVVETAGNLQETIITIVEDGELKIYSKKSTNHFSGKRNVYVYVKKLDAVTASGGSDVYAETMLNFPALNIEMSGGSDLKLRCTTQELRCSLTGGSDAVINGSAGKADLEATGGSDFKASGLTIGRCKIEVTGGSDANLNVTGELSVVASGSSDVTYTGNPKIVSKSVTGASDLIRK
jgi:hypothetical protein